MTAVFVYGTLKRGGSNHLFLARQKFLGPARTVPGYTLYSLGDFPGMVLAPGDTAGVEGEVWSVDDECLAELDRFEGVDEGLYQRVGVALTASSAVPTAQAYLYPRPLDGLPPIGSNWPVGPVT